MTESPVHPRTRHAASRCVLGAFVGGAIALLAAAPLSAQSENIDLYAQLTPGDFGAGSGNDCWGYTSASGREYALMGLNNRVGVVEIVDPANPVIIGTISHFNSIWCDIKVYGDYAYAVNESGGGIDVIDLSDVDNGNVSLVRRVTSNGMQSAHNVAVDEASGFLYTVGGNIGGGGVVAWDLTDPSDPTYAGAWTGSYVHDAHVITYDSGPYAGKQMAFCASGGDGIYVVDVSNKSSMSQVSRTTYSGLAYCHQLWVSEDRNYLYVDDEMDELFGYANSTRTLVFDITDLSNLSLLNTFTTGLPSIDHNLYEHNGFIYEANYTSGVHIFDARTNPTDPDYVGFYDTFPSNNSVSYDGAWSVYPFFPSGTLIVSDQQGGLFILDPSAAIGTPFSIDVDPIVGGEVTTIYASGARPGDAVYFIYSLRGLGSTWVPALGVNLDLRAPALAGSAVADGNGDAQYSQEVPAIGSGRTVWLQGAQVGDKTDVLERQIQ